jgi:ribosome-associated protein
LKFTGAVETGGEAKLAINEGRVRRNGRICLQRGGKLRHGDIVGYDGFLWRISGGNADK